MRRDRQSRRYLDDALERINRAEDIPALFAAFDQIVRKAADR